MPDRWYVAQTLPNAERHALAQIQAEGFAAFCPTITEALSPWTKSGARRQGPLVRQAPMFSGYVLIIFDITNPPHQPPWQRINKCEGVNRLLPAMKEHPDPIIHQYEAFINNLRQITQDGALTRDEALDASTQYLAGELVPIIAGLFKDQAGTYLSKYKSAAGLFLMLQGAAGTLKVPADCVAPAPKRR